MGSIQTIVNNGFDLANGFIELAVNTFKSAFDLATASL